MRLTVSVSWSRSARPFAPSTRAVDRRPSTINLEHDPLTPSHHAAIITTTHDSTARSHLLVLFAHGHHLPTIVV